MYQKQYILIFSLSIFISLLVYSSSLDYYFFQDDFFEINISKASSIKEYFKFFLFRDDIIAYRPISLQNYFFINLQFFNLNPIGFRFVTLLFFIGSAFLVSKIVSKISKNYKVGLLSASFWVLSSIHFMSISWIAAAYNIIGTFFWLLTSLSFLRYINNKKKYYYFLTIFLFIITIGSFEFSVTWPAIFGLYYFYVKKTRVLKSLITFSPFILITIIYLILRIFLIKVPEISEYSISFNVNSIKAFFWYLLWTFNIPEEFKKQVTNNLIMFNQTFLFEFWKLIAITFIGLLWMVTLTIIFPIFEIVTKKAKINKDIVIFFLFWFIIGISPVLVLPNHTFTMYLTLSSIGIYALISYLIVSTKIRSLLILILIIWVVTSIYSINFYKINSWMVETQKTAKKFSINLKNTHPYLPKKSVVFYPLYATSGLQSLLENNAIRAIYNDQSLSIYYNKEDLIDNIEIINNKPVYYSIP